MRTYHRRVGDEPALRRLVREAGLLLGALWVAALVLAVPITDGNRVVGAHGDLEQFLWQIHRLPDALQGDWVSNDAFLGMPVAFAAVPTTWIHSALVLVVGEATGNVFFAYNAVLLGLLATNFVSTYAVARLLGYRSPIAVVAGVVFALASNSLVHAEGGHAGLTITAAFPWVLYAFVRLRGEPAARRWWVVLGVAVGACGYAHEYWLMGALLTIPLAALLRGSWLWRDRAVLTGAAIALVVAVTMNLPMILAFVERARLDHAQGVETTRTAREGVVHSAPAPVYIVPSDRNPLWRHAPLPYEHTNHIETVNYVGIVNLGVLGAAGGALLIRRRRRTHAPAVDAVASPLRQARSDLVALAVFGLVLGFGTRIRLNNGVLHLPPDLFFSWGIPGYEHVRSWGRYGIIVMLAAVFATADVLRRWLHGRVLSRAVLWSSVAALGVVALIDQQPQWPVPMHRIRVPHSIDLVKDTPRDRFVMHVPLGVNDPIHNTTAMVLQRFHGRTIVNGYATGQPRYEERFSTTPLACVAWPYAADHVDDRACDPGRLAPALERLGIGTIVYEHTTPNDLDIGFTANDDEMLRRRTVELLDGLERTGWLEVLAIESPYTIYRFARPGT
jgi:hypothetical protein